jgi:hypothetical protein
LCTEIRNELEALSFARLPVYPITMPRRAAIRFRHKSTWAEVA